MRQLSAVESRGPRSIPWKEAKTLLLDFVKAKHSISTFDDFRKIFDNTPELKVLEGQNVASVSDMDIAEIIALRALHF